MTGGRGWADGALGEVIDDPVRPGAYERDGLTGYRVRPEIVVLPRDAAGVVRAVQLCHRNGVLFVARGAGTGLSGGSPGGVVSSASSSRCSSGAAAVA